MKINTIFATAIIAASLMAVAQAKAVGVSGNVYYAPLAGPGAISGKMTKANALSRAAKVLKTSSKNLRVFRHTHTNCKGFYTKTITAKWGKGKTPSRGRLCITNNFAEVADKAWINHQNYKYVGKK